MKSCYKVTKSHMLHMQLLRCYRHKVYKTDILSWDNHRAIATDQLVELEEIGKLSKKQEGLYFF